MSTGLRQESHIKMYAQEICKLARKNESKESWFLPDIKTLGEKMLDQARRRLNACSVPKPEPKWNNDAQFTANGQFAFSGWQVELSQRIWEASLPAADSVAFWQFISEAADTIYHECRHCEQWFRMAIYMGMKEEKKGLGLTADSIARTMWIPLKIAKKAKKKSLSGEFLREAQAWRHSVYPERKLRTAKRDMIGKGIAQPTAFAMLGQTIGRDVKLGKLGLRRTPGGGRTAQISRVVQTRSGVDYLELAEETDAWATGGKVQQEIYTLAKTPRYGVVGLGQPRRPPHRALRNQLANAGGIQ
jgi:hypothetical protein